MDMTEAEEKALREAAYEGEDEPEAPPQEPEKQEEPEKEPEPEPAQEEDPWAGVPPALRQQIEQITERVNALPTIENRLKQAERRVGSIQNEFYAAQKAAKEQKNAPTKEQLEEAAKSQKAWDEMKEDFPEIATAIEAKLAESKPPDIETLRDELRTEIQGRTTNEDLERRLVGIAHRDWQTVVTTEDYKTWLKRQSQEVQERALYGKTAEEAIDVLDRYKASKTKKPLDKKTDRLERSVDAPRGPSKRPAKSEADLSEEELRQQIAQEVWS